jgi:hypothetical protein
MDSKPELDPERATPMTAAPKAERPGHDSPCAWSQALIWGFSVLTLIGGVAIGAIYSDSKELRSIAAANQQNIREVQTDIKYIRESQQRLEDLISGRPARP